MCASVGYRAKKIDTNALAGKFECPYQVNEKRQGVLIIVYGLGTLPDILLQEMAILSIQSLWKEGAVNRIY